MLRSGDMLALARAPQVGVQVAEAPAPLTRDWQVEVLYGPHGAPDFFPMTISRRCSARAYEVHFNSARTGVRLIGPTPHWARTDGGEAGLHPSNLHDNAYAIGAMDFTGDMPIILGPDGPSLGGFVCPAVIAREDQWKMGQFKPGDSHPLSARLTRPADPIAGPAHRADTGPARPFWRAAMRARCRWSIAVRATTICWSNMAR